MLGVVRRACAYPISELAPCFFSSYNSVLLAARAQAPVLVCQLAPADSLPSQVKSSHVQSSPVSISTPSSHTLHVTNITTFALHHIDTAVTLSCFRPTPATPPVGTVCDSSLRPTHSHSPIRHPRLTTDWSSVLPYTLLCCLGHCPPILLAKEKAALRGRQPTTVSDSDHPLRRRQKSCISIITGLASRL